MSDALAADERQEWLNYQRKAAERTKIAYEALLAIGLPVELAQACVAQSWTPAAHMPDQSAAGMAMAKDVEKLVESVTHDHDEDDS